MGIATAITAAAAIGGSIIGGKSSKKAARTVAESSDQQIALQREIYQDQRGLQMPFYNTGVKANAAASELLGLGGASSQKSPQQQSPLYGGGGQFGQSSGINSQRYAGREDYDMGSGDGYRSQKMTGPSPLYGQRDGSYRPGGGGERMQGGYQPPMGERTSMQGQQQGSNTGNSQLDAIRNSPGYQFRMNEGQNMLETGAAARGGLLSGGHIRQGTRYAQDYASGEYNNRFNQLQALQSGGQAASNNIQNAGSQYGANASNSMQNSSNFAANQQIQRGSMYGGALGGVLGGIGGMI